MGFPRTAVFPILLDMERYGKSDTEVEISLKGKTPLFLNVSRIVPSKHTEDIIRTFYYYRKCISPEAWLFLVGSPEVGGTYLRQLQQLVNALKLEHVVFTGSVSDAALVAYYKQADVFLTMSEHEGFGVPLVEAMFFGVPIVANNACAIPYTLGGSGVLVNNKSIPVISELLQLIMMDKAELRSRLVARQKERFESFHPVSVRALLRKHLELVGVVFPCPQESG
jgi:glycosyltransferase involved in cell wall biosynthesis